MSHIDPDDGCEYTDNDEVISAEVLVTLRISIAMCRMPDLDSINEESIAQAIKDDYNMDAEVVDYDVTSWEIDQ